MRILLSLLLLGTLACGRPVRPLPEHVSLAAAPTILATAARAAGADQEPPADPEIVWRAEVGRGLQSPLIVQEPVLLAAAANRIVAALATETGEHFWERRMEGPATAGLLADERAIYFVAEEADGKAFALELGRGRTRWQRRIGSSAFPPVLVGDTIFAVTDAGIMHAIPTRTGQVAWRSRLQARAATGPVAYGEVLLLPTTRDTVLLVARSDGAVRERRALPGTVSALPALLGDTLVVPYHSGVVVAYQLPAFTEIARVETGAPVLAAPVAPGDGYAYILNTHAEVWRLGPDGGERIVDLDGAARASLSAASGHLLVGRLDGTLVLLRRDGAEVWRRKFEDAIVAPVTVRDGAVYVPLLRGIIVKLR